MFFLMVMALILNGGSLYFSPRELLTWEYPEGKRFKLRKYIFSIATKGGTIT